MSQHSTTDTPLAKVDSAKTASGAGPSSQLSGHAAPATSKPIGKSWGSKLKAGFRELGDLEDASVCWPGTGGWASRIQVRRASEYMPCPNWLILSPVATLIYVILRGQKLNIALFFFYLPLFPFIFPVIAIFKLFQSTIILRQAVRYVLFPATSLVAAAVALPLLVVTWVVLFQATDHVVILVFVIAEVVLNKLTLAIFLRWASDPLSPFLALVAAADWIQTGLDQAKASTPSKVMTEEERKRDVDSKKNILQIVLVQFGNRLVGSHRREGR